MFYHNATSSVHGTWTRHELAENVAPYPRSGTEGYHKRILSEATGELAVGIEEGNDGEVELVIRVKDIYGGRETVLAGFRGYHDVSHGAMVATTSWEGRDALAWMWLDEQGGKKRWNATRVSSERWIKRLMKRVKERGPEAAEEVEEGEKKCDYVVWLQLHPVDLSREEMDLVEQELRQPTGVTMPGVPVVEVAVMLWSPTCGGVVTSAEMVGDKVEVFFGRVSAVGLGAALVTVLQMGALIRQMEKSSTPSTVSRVSFWTMGVLAMQDGYWFLVFMIVAIYLGTPHNPHFPHSILTSSIEGCFLPLATASFFYLILLTMFEMRFLLKAYKIQRPEPPSPSPAPHRPPTPSSLPAPVTTTPAPSSRTRTDLSTLQTRFYFFLLAALILTLHATSWSPLYRDTFFHLLLLLSNSFWAPQIYRNIYRGTRRPFAFEFIIGTTLCRMVPMAYLYLYPKNVFNISPHPLSVVGVAAWQLTQVSILAAQAFFGARCVVPRILVDRLPHVWDYHAPPYLAGAGDEEGMEAEAAVGLLEGVEQGEGGEEQEEGDCAICMTPVERVGRDAGVMERRKVMWTPCVHCFHTECLEGWMRYRLQCPVCRNALPPL